MNGLRILALGFGAACAAQAACAQSAAPPGGQSTVTIIDPAQVGEVSQLRFAPMVRPGETSGMAVEGQTARYTIRGMAGDSVNLTMPLSMKLVKSGGSDEVVLTLIPAGATTTVLVGKDGLPSSAAFGLRGALGVENAPPPGTYSGSYSVILSLQ